MLTDIVFDMTKVLSLIFIFFINFGYINTSRKISSIASLALAAFIFIFLRHLVGEILVFIYTWKKVFAELGFF